MSSFAQASVAARRETCRRAGHRRSRGDRSSSKARKAGSAGKPPGEIIRAIAGLSDGTISLRRKIILSRSAALAPNDDALA